MNDGCLDIRVAGRTLFVWSSIVIFPLVFIGGGLLGIRQLIVDQRRGEASVSWQRVPAQIDTATMDDYANRKARAMRVVAYRSSYGGHEYSSTRVSFSSSTSRKKKHALYARYKDGGTITVFVNPADPSLAVIEPGRPPINVALLVFSVLGILSGITAGRILLKKDPSEEARAHRKTVKRPRKRKRW
jgi:hypothetical protein